MGRLVCYIDKEGMAIPCIPSPETIKEGQCWDCDNKKEHYDYFLPPRVRKFQQLTEAKRLEKVPATLDKQKVIDALKQARMNLDGADERKFLYGTGRNIVADIMLIEIVMGNLDYEGEKSTKTAPADAPAGASGAPTIPRGREE